MPYKIISLIQSFIFLSFFNCFAFPVKQAEFGDQFYPSAKEDLSKMINNFLEQADPLPAAEQVLILFSPHAGYGFSGQTAAYGYKLIENKNYKTVIILGTSHHKRYNGAALYGPGNFVTSLGKIEIDEEFTKKIVNRSADVFADTSVFSNEHSVEVQLPFLQKVLTNYKIVPVVVGDCSLETCRKIAGLFKEAIGQRRDVLVVVSTDLYHGYDFEEADRVDKITLDFFKKLDYQGLYYSLRDGNAQACGGFAAVIALSLAKDLNAQTLEVLNHTNSARVSGQLTKGNWTVGYSSCAVLRQEGGGMLTPQQKQKLLKIARDSISQYLQTGKKLTVNEIDPVLNKKMGAFVTLNQHNELRGCIGNLIGSQPLYLTVSDMAVEAAVGDPRFAALSLPELGEVQIDISVLSELKKVPSAEDIELGKHGVLVRRGSHSGVFLPQVATETGWSKEEFLNNLCAHKAGLAAGAWKDKDTEIYVFTAEVFSEKEPGK
ncbi:MAG TPA: AmmeMemoRadiSam system protein B [Candidatus Omnitrophota bacterium]|nr:AmmeMemoRadiSam system protein B [Candidatus Omnitrophota bacterium]HPT39440.1 AmmeMemoRadiSam system protein B [Candidatus Omnitrophota bacterium]